MGKAEEGKEPSRKRGRNLPLKQHVQRQSERRKLLPRPRKSEESEHVQRRKTGA